jgi:hypothetical protein
MRFVMGIAYIAFIAEDHYKAFKIILTTPLPSDYGMWLRVRERGKTRAISERAATVTEVDVSPIEFGAYCKGLKRPDFCIAALDRCAREKAMAQGRGLGALVSDAGVRFRKGRRVDNLEAGIGSHG